MKCRVVASIAGSTAVLALGGLSFATAPASADPCVGDSSLAVCEHTYPGGKPVQPGAGPTVGDCVYLGSDTCTPVYLTLPGVYPGQLPDPVIYCKPDPNCGINPG
ncbi:MAG: hypothetical protein QOI82_3453 [Actinomycetota bacterium]|nr:hypothetical protein [Actinomycetota bacterium]